MGSSTQSRQRRALQSLAYILGQDDTPGRKQTEWILTLPDDKLYEFAAYVVKAFTCLEAMMDVDKYLGMGAEPKSLLDAVEPYIRQGMEQGLLWPLLPEEIEAIKPEDGKPITVEQWGDKRIKIVPIRDMVMLIPMPTEDGDRSLASE